MEQRNVFITGASSGLGRGLALHYARAGATVYAAARRKPELNSLAKEAEGASGRIAAVPLDVLDTEALVAALASAEESSGGALDLVIANAGVGDVTSGRKLDWRTVKRIMDVNVSAAAVTLAAPLPAMVKRKRGTIVAMASLAGFRGLPDHGAYCGSKAALHVFMESLRVDLRGSGVRAITIYPGFVKTELTAKNKGPMPFIMELDDAVKVMARGIDRGSPTISYPLPLSAAVTAMQALPRGLYEPLAGLGRRKKPKGADAK